MSHEIDFDTLREYADNAFQRPSDAAFWDERCYTTHVPVIGWAERGDDVLEESNYRAALDLIRSAADDGRPDTEISDEHVIDGTSSHWLVGSLRQIWVQVYETPECEGHYDDDYTLIRAGIGEATYCDGTCVPKRDREFTAAFEEAVRIQESLRDYPVLDESDYSEREWEQFEEWLKRAVEDAQREWVELDTVAQEQAISSRFYEDEYAPHRSEWCRSDDIDWEAVAASYRKARDEYFTELGMEFYRSHILGIHEDQLELFSA